MFAQPFPRKTMAAPQDAPAVKKHPMSFGPDIYTSTLENGLQVVILPDPRLPLAHVGMSVKTGAISETPDTNGLAHLYEHMFFTANEAYPTSTAFENRERELGIASNAFTSEEAVVYYFSLPSDNLNPGVEFMSDAMLKPLFKEEELKQERNVVLDEYNTRTSRPPRRLSRAVDRTLFYEYPWRRSTLGEKEVIKKATREDMLEFKQKYYRPDNSCVIIAGDVTPSNAVEVVERHFAGWKPNTPDVDGPPDHPPLEDSRSLVIGGDVKYAMLHTSQFGPPVNTDPAATYAADVWGTLLSMSSSRFQQNLVDQGPYQNASLSYYTQQNGPVISFRGTFSPDRREEALKALHRELANMGKPGYFTKQQLEAARTRLIVKRKSGVENGRSHLQSLGFWWAVTGLDYYTGYLENLREVTLDEIRSFCKKYVIDKPRVYGLLLPSEMKESEEVTSGSVLDRVRTLQDASYELAGKADADASAPGIDDALRNVSFDAPAESTTTFFRLSNGIPVIHRAVTENDVLSLKVFLDGGTMNYGDRPAGIEQFLLKTMLRGSESYPLNRLQSVTDREGISLSSSANYDFSRLSAGGLTEDLPLVLDLLEDLLRQPLLKTDQVEWVRGQMLNSVKRRRANPRRQVWHVANRLLFRNHPYQTLPGGTLKSLKNIDRDLLASHHEDIAGSGRMLISAVGRLSADRLKEKLNDTLGTIEKTSYERSGVPDFQPGGQRMTIDSRQGLSTAFIAAKTPLPSMSSPDYPALKLGLEVLSNRIFEETRTKRGLTYGAYAGMPFYRRNWGYLFVTTPKPNLAMSLIYRELQEMKQKTVEKPELNRTANVLFTNQLLERQTASSIANLLGRHELVGNGWESFGEVLEKIRSLSPADVRSAIRTHVNAFYFGVIQGPAMKNRVNRDLYLHPEKAIENLSEQEKGSR